MTQCPQITNASWNAILLSIIDPEANEGNMKVGQYVE